MEAPTEEKVKSNDLWPVAMPRWESNTNIILGYNSKLTKTPRDCHNNNTDTENTVS